METSKRYRCHSEGLKLLHVEDKSGKKLNHKQGTAKALQDKQRAYGSRRKCTSQDQPTKTWKSPCSRHDGTTLQRQPKAMLSIKCHKCRRRDPHVDSWNCTKPKPRGSPVILLRIRMTSFRAPHFPKCVLSMSSVVCQVRPPRKIFPSTSASESQDKVISPVNVKKPGAN